MRFLINFARDYPWQSLTMLLALLFASLAEGLSLTALLPLLSTAIGEETSGAGDIITDALVGLGLTPTIGVLLVFIVCGIALKSALVLVANKRVGYTVAQVTTELRLSLLRAMLATRWEYYLHQRIGRLANAMTSEAIRASNAYVNGATVLMLFIQAIVYTGIALFVSWQATLACLGAGAVILLISRYLVRMSRKAGKRQTKLLRSLIARLTDTLQSVKTLKAMARENLADSVLAAETTRLNQALRREVFSDQMLKATQDPMFALVIAIGVYFSLAHWNLPLATVMMMVVLMGRLIGQLGKIQRQYQKLVVGESAFWSLQEAIADAQREREPLEGNLAPTLKRAIRLDQISFAYGDHAILRHLSLTIPVGTLTTLVGPSGAGKTTVVDLVTGLLKPQQGRILIDDQALELIDLRAWRKLIGYVPQENLLLHDTVLNNVTLGDPELGEADAERALRAAGAWEFVAALPQGMHQTVGERGAKLSGGQRQRIMIARALAHQPRLLILDEATSALDPTSEAAICNTLQTLRGELTILAISHQPALVDTADRVYRLKDGGAMLVTERQALSVIQ